MPNAILGMFAVVKLCYVTLTVAKRGHIFNKESSKYHTTMQKCNVSEVEKKEIEKNV